MSDIVIFLPNFFGDFDGCRSFCFMLTSPQSINNMCKAIDDWLQEKREEGIQEVRRTIIANMLKCGMDEAQICELAECDIHVLEEIRQTLLTA